MVGEFGLRRTLISVVIVVVLVGLLIVRPWASPAQSREEKYKTEISNGLAAMQSGDVEAARQAFTKAIALDPNSAVAHYDLGVVVLQYDANLQAAIDLFTTALILDPKFTSAQYNRAIANKSLGKFEEAIVDLRAVVAVKPNDANALKKLGELLVQTGKLDEGTALLEKAYQLDPNLK